MANEMLSFYTMQKTSTDSSLTVQAIEIILQPEMIEPAKSFTVYADTITIDTDLKLVGHPILLNARRIVVAGARTISTASALSAEEMTRWRNAPAAAGKDGGLAKDKEQGKPGEGGTDGHAGADCPDGGDITLIAESIVFTTAGKQAGTLTLITSGGDGAPGQDGGKGGQGGTGANGHKDCPEGHGADAASTAGGSGGSGGLAGLGGRGGSGGNVSIQTIEPLEDKMITTVSLAGHAGALGKAGLGGVGGSEGEAGSYWTTTEGDGSYLRPHRILVNGAFGGNGYHGGSGKGLAYIYLDFSMVNILKLEAIARKQRTTWQDVANEKYGSNWGTAKIVPPAPPVKNSSDGTSGTYSSSRIVYRDFYDAWLLEKSDFLAKDWALPACILVDMDWRRAIPPEQYKLTLYAAKLAYLNASDVKSYQQAFQLLLWVTRTTPSADRVATMQRCSEPLKGNAPVDRAKVDAQPIALRRKIDFYLQAETSFLRLCNTGSELSGIHDTAASLLIQLSRGLDFFGNPWNYVPLLEIEGYHGQFNTLLTAGKIIEDSVKEYKKTVSNQEAAKATLKTAIQQHESLIPQLVHAAAESAKARTALETQLQSTLNVLQQKQEYLEKNSRTFVEAVKRHLQWKIALGVFDLIKQIVPLGKGVAGLGDLIDVGDQVADEIKKPARKEEKEERQRSKSLPDVNEMGKNKGEDDKKEKKEKSAFDQLGDIANKGIKVYKSGADLIAAISALNSADEFKQYGPLVMDQDEFDKMIEPVYADAPAEADVYRRSFADFMDTVQLRHNLDRQIAAALADEATTDALVQAGRAEVDRLKELIAQQFDANSGPILSYLLGVYDVARTRLLSFLYQTNQAMGYWSLTPVPFSIASDTDIAAFAIKGSHMYTAYIDLMNKKTGIRQSGDLMVRWTRDEFPEQFEALEARKPAYFSLALDNPSIASQLAGKAEMYAITYRLVAPGIVVGDGKKKSGGSLFAYLTHTGSASVLRAGDSVTLSFCHLKQDTYFSYSTSRSPKKVDDIRKSEGGNLSETNHILLSPFAVWRLEMPKEDKLGNELNPKLALKKVKNIDITFAVTNRPSIRSKASLRKRMGHIPGE